MKSFLSVKTLEIAIHALITTHLDCNSLYFGISKYSIARLQLVQNAAAKFVTLLQFWNRYIGYLCILELSSKFFSMF